MNRKAENVENVTKRYIFDGLSNAVYSGRMIIINEIGDKK